MSHTTCWNWNCYLRVVISVFLTCNVYLHGIAILGNQCTWDVKLFSIFTFEIQRAIICFSITLLTGGTRLMEVENIFCFVFFSPRSSPVQFILHKRVGSCFFQNITTV